MESYVLFDLYGQEMIYEYGGWGWARAGQGQRDGVGEAEGQLGVGGLVVEQVDFC